jgi:hypothetical protein
MTTPEQINADDYESTLRLLADTKDLIRADYLTPETKLMAIDQALTEAIGGSPEKARDFVLDVILQRLEP